MTIVKELDALHVNWEEYKFPAGEWDMKYADFSLVEKTGATVTLDLFSYVEPSANFTVNAPSEIKEGQMYILRVVTWATPYTMTLWTWITNPYSESTTLVANTVHQFGFLAIDWDLELQPSADVSPYIAWTGINIANKQISIDNTVVATQTDLAWINQVPSGWTTGQVLKKTANWYDWWTDNDTTYTAWTWLTLSGTEFSADTTVLATKTDLANIWSYEVVATLPSAETADTKKIYLLWPIGTGADKYEEWIVVDNAWWECEWQLNEIPLVLGNSNTVAYVEAWDPVLSELTATRWHTIYIWINYTTSTSSYNKTRFNFWPRSYYYWENYNDVPHIQTQSMGQYDGFSWWVNWNMRIGTSKSTNQLVDYSMVWSFSQITYRTKAWTKIWETSIDISGKQDKATSWSTAPATTPSYVGQQYVDTTNNKLYVATGTTSSSDWTEVWAWSWDMLYQDFNWVTKTWATVTLDINSTITPSANFTVNAPSTIKDWQIYILRVVNWATAYTMTLGTWITNPYNTSTTLTANFTDQFVFQAIGWSLELLPDTEIAISWNVAPAITPAHIWQQYINTSTNIPYIATWVSNSSDWQTIPILSKQTWAATNIKFWIWTTTAYENLGSYDNNTVYICKKVVS